MKKNGLTFLIVIVLMFCSVPLTGQTNRTVKANALSEMDITGDNEIRIDYEQDKKIYNKTTLDEDFSDETILVVLNSSATISFKRYASKDFAEIGKFDVEEITAETSNTVKQQRETEARLGKDIVESGKMESVQEAKRHLVNTSESYRRILKLTLKNKGKENVLNAIRLLEKRDEVVSAEPSFSGSIDATPTEWNTLTTTQKWSFDKINATSAWDITTGANSNPITVAVVDSGIDSTHPDLSNRISTIPSIDHVGSNALADPNGHGTHVAGTIGAQPNNGGVVGVHWNVRFVSIRVFDAAGNGTSNYTSQLTSAVTYAAQRGIDIINHSGGGNSGTTSVVNAFKTALQNYNGLFVCTAGNNGANNDNNSARFPSNVRIPNLISVGNSAQDDTRWSSSNYGAATVDIFAPGVSIYSTIPVSQGSYGYKTGSSMSAPMVAGVAALLKSVDNNLNAVLLKQIIRANAEPVSGFNALCNTGGRLNAWKCLQSLQGNQIQNGEIYSIKNYASGYALNAANFGDGASVTHSTYQNASNQHWKAIYNSDDGTYSFRPMSSQTKILESLSYKMVIHNNYFHDGKKFYIIKQSNEQYRFIPKNAILQGKNNVVAVTDATSGQQVVECAENNTTFQRWTFTATTSWLPENGKTYSIKNTSTNLVAHASGTGNGSGVVQQTYTGATNQKWKAVYNSDDGTYSFQPMNATSSWLESLSYKMTIYNGPQHDGKRFYITYQNGSCKITPKNAAIKGNNNVMAINSGSTGSQIIETSYTGSSQQFWVLTAV